jgi:hypothetical protein
MDSSELHRGSQAMSGCEATPQHGGARGVIVLNAGKNDATMSLNCKYFHDYVQSSIFESVMGPPVAQDAINPSLGA